MKMLHKGWRQTHTVRYSSLDRLCAQVYLFNQELICFDLSFNVKFNRRFNKKPLDEKVCQRFQLESVLMPFKKPAYFVLNTKNYSSENNLICDMCKKVCLTGFERNLCSLTSFCCLAKSYVYFQHDLRQFHAQFYSFVSFLLVTYVFFGIFSISFAQCASLEKVQYAISSTYERSLFLRHISK